MGKSSAHRKLSTQLEGWDVGRIATLLQRRPDLATPHPPANIAELAQRAQHLPSVRAAIDVTTLAENRFLQVLVCLRPSVPDVELAAALPEGTTLADVEPVLESLEDLALVWRHDGRTHCSGTLRQCMPTGLGPPVHDFERLLTVDHLRHAIQLLRAHLAEAGVGPLLAPAEGPDGRPPRKGELLDELAGLLSASGAADALVAAAPFDAAKLLSGAIEHRQGVHIPFHLYYSRHSASSYFSRDPSYWLFERAALLPVDDRWAFAPRELVLSMLGGRPSADLCLERPSPALRPLDPAEVDSSGAARASSLLDQMADVLERWREQPAKALKAGGLGATALKPLARDLDVEVADAARLVELLHLAGLLKTTTTSRREKRTYVHETTIGPRDPAASAWLDRPAATRWRQLAEAWLRSDRWPSLAGRPLGDAKPLPAMGAQHDLRGAAPYRAEVIDLLARQAVGEAISPADLIEVAYWDRPQMWLGIGATERTDPIAWIMDEAEMLGVIAHGALSGFGRALVSGDSAGAEAALGAALPEPATTFTIQADLTAVVVGSLERDVLRELRLLADVESTGAATTFRFSDASLRRGLDAGRDAASIATFLERHAARGVPQALTYLVDDVARRHGHLAVGAAASFVSSEDPAVLADAVSHRGARKLGLRLLAPTVAISTLPADKVTGALRDMGFLPVSHDDSPGGEVAISAPAVSDAAVGDDDRAEIELPEPYRARPQRQTTSIDADGAAQLAAVIRAGVPDTSPGASRFRAKDAGGTVEPGTPHLFAVGSGGDPILVDDELDDLDDLDLAIADELDTIEDLDELFTTALKGGHLVAVVEDDDGSEPILLSLEAWDGHELVGTDIVDDRRVTLYVDELAAAIDIGPAPTQLPHRGRSRGRRR